MNVSATPLRSRHGLAQLDESVPHSRASRTASRTRRRSPARSFAPAGLALLVGRDREAEAKAAIVTGLAPDRTADGDYLLENEFRYLLARLSAAAVDSAVD